MIKYTIAGIAFSALSFGLYGQGIRYCDSIPGNGKPGAVHATMAPAGRLVLEPVVDHDNAPELNGYRVQAFSGTSREDAERIKGQLEQMYPKYPVYFSYESPYFKVRIGDFRSRLDAQQMLYELRTRFESVLLVPDKINFPTLN